jgi:hypothetical protein
MNKFQLLNFIQCSFKTKEVLSEIKLIDSYNSWGVQNTEQIGDRGIVLKIKNPRFDGYILVTVDESDVFVVRTLNLLGMTQFINKIKDVDGLVYVVNF